MRKPKESPTTSGTGELKAVAREAWELGEHALHAAANWLDNKRTPNMNKRNQEGNRQVPTSGTAAGYPYGRGDGDRDWQEGMGRSQRDYAAGARGSGDFEAAADRGFERRGSWRDEGMRGYQEPHAEGSYRSDSRQDMQERAYGRDSYGMGRQQGDWQDSRGGYAGAYGNQRQQGGMNDMQRGSRSRDYGYPQAGREYGAGYGQSSGYGQSGASYGQSYGTSGSGYDYRQSGQTRDFESRRGLGPRSYARTDERIREDVNERLLEDDYVDARGISVQVREGSVTLSGTVEERWEKHRAEDIADACSGVRDVQNNIRVERDPSRSESRSAGATTTATGANSSAI